MFKTIEHPAACEIRSVIRFLNERNTKACEIHRQICEVYGSNAMSDSMVRRWVRHFNEGRENVHDNERSGRPSLIDEDLIAAVNAKIMENRRFTITTLSLQIPQISRSLLHEVVSEKLKFRKLCARWVPHNLTEQQRLKRQASALDFLTRYNEEGDAFLSRIVTGDETWVCHVTPESKLQSMEWRHTSSPTKTKAKPLITCRKLMCTVFWDRHGVLLVDFMARGQTVNTARYCETLRKLRRAIQNKRRGMLRDGILLIHDNARPHTAHDTQQCLMELRWEVFDHPPYSPDLAPSDFHLFKHLKSFLAGKQFRDDDEIRSVVIQWLQSQAASFFDKGIQTLVPRYDKCLNNGGTYVEK